MNDWRRLRDAASEGRRASERIREFRATVDKQKAEAEKAARLAAQVTPRSLKLWRKARMVMLMLKFVDSLKDNLIHSIKLTPSEMARAESLFDTSPAISTAEELRYILAKMGLVVPLPELQRILTDLSIGVGKYLEKGEFMFIVTSVKREQALIDLDHDFEIRNTFSHLGNQHDTYGLVPVSAIQGVLQNFELGLHLEFPQTFIDGQMDYSEFCRMVKTDNTEDETSEVDFEEYLQQQENAVRREDCFNMIPESPLSPSVEVEFADGEMEKPLLVHRRRAVHKQSITSHAKVKQLKLTRENPNRRLNKLFDDLEKFLHRVERNRQEKTYLRSLNQTDTKKDFVDWLVQETDEQNFHKMKQYGKMMGRIRRLSHAPDAQQMLPFEGAFRRPSTVSQSHSASFDPQQSPFPAFDSQQSLSQQQQVRRNSNNTADHCNDIGELSCDTRITVTTSPTANQDVVLDLPPKIGSAVETTKIRGGAENTPNGIPASTSDNSVSAGSTVGVDGVDSTVGDGRTADEPTVGTNPEKSAGNNSNGTKPARLSLLSRANHRKAALKKTQSHQSQKTHNDQHTAPPPLLLPHATTAEPPTGDSNGTATSNIEETTDNNTHGNRHHPDLPPIVDPLNAQQEQQSSLNKSSEYHPSLFELLEQQQGTTTLIPPEETEVVSPVVVISDEMPTDVLIYNWMPTTQANNSTTVATCTTADVPVNTHVQTTVSIRPMAPHHGDEGEEGHYYYSPSDLPDFSGHSIVADHNNTIAPLLPGNVVNNHHDHHDHHTTYHGTAITTRNAPKNIMSGPPVIDSGLHVSSHSRSAVVENPLPMGPQFGGNDDSVKPLHQHQQQQHNAPLQHGKGCNGHAHGISSFQPKWLIHKQNRDKEQCRTKARSNSAHTNKLQRCGHQHGSKTANNGRRKIMHTVQNQPMFYNYSSGTYRRTTGHVNPGVTSPPMEKNCPATRGRKAHHSNQPPSASKPLQEGGKGKPFHTGPLLSTLFANPDMSLEEQSEALLAEFNQDLDVTEEEMMDTLRRPHTSAGYN